MFKKPNNSRDTSWGKSKSDSQNPKKEFGAKPRIKKEFDKKQEPNSYSERGMQSRPNPNFTHNNSFKPKPKPKFIREGKPPDRKETNILDNGPVRLNKVIAESGVTSRRKADELITAGSVKVNGTIVNQLGYKVNPGDKITVNGNPIPEVLRKVYILFNKPKDLIISTKDEKDRTTVMDVVKSSVRIFPVGRLDRNTTGALLLTNDGEIAHRLLHPSYQIERTYSVLLDKELLPKDAEQISKGVELEDGMTSPCNVFFDPRSRKKIILTLKEGRNHEVKRIFMYLGYNVKQLDRKVFADLSVQRMERGEYRHLNRAEIIHLKKLVNLEY